MSAENFGAVTTAYSEAKTGNSVQSTHSSHMASIFRVDGESPGVILDDKFAGASFIFSERCCGSTRFLENVISGGRSVAPA